jgi:hypothetical protein
MISITRLVRGSLVVAAVAAFAATITASPASAATITDLDIVVENTGRTSSNKSATAECDPGQRVLAAGAWLVNANGNVRVTDLIPRDDYVYAFAREDEDGTTASWDLYVSATCADPLSDMEIVERTSTVTSDPYNGVVSDCTGDNELLGTGYRINDGLGQVGIDDFAVLGSTRLTATAYEDDTGFSGSWSVTTFAVCADAPTGLEHIDTVSGDTSNYVNTHVAGCTGDKEIIGGGGQVDGGQGHVIIEDLQPDNDEFTVTAMEDDNGTGALWHVHAFAICADEI